MVSGKNRIVARAGFLLAALILAGCTRDAAIDPLATPTPGTQGQSASTTAANPSSTPTAISVGVANVTPATSTPLPPATNTPQPQLTAAAVTAAPTATPQATVQSGGEVIYTVQAGDRLFSIGRQFGVNPYSIAQANGLQPPYVIHPGDKLKIPGATTPPSGTCQGHLVLTGENLFRIALKYNKSVAAIAAANNITNVSLIQTGTCLKIP